MADDSWRLLRFPPACSDGCEAERQSRRRGAVSNPGRSRAHPGVGAGLRARGSAVRFPKAAEGGKGVQPVRHSRQEREEEMISCLSWPFGSSLMGQSGFLLAFRAHCQASAKRKQEANRTITAFWTP